MLKYLSLVSLTLLWLLLILSPSCTDEYGGSDSVTDQIKTGQKVEISSTPISSTGGTIKVSKPGTPVDGVEIVIPPGAYATTQTIDIAYSEIKSHLLGAYFNPVSPLINVRCDGGYSNDLMTITIPVNIPDGHIPIGFYLDRSTGKLEGIPVASATSNSITLLTRHFFSGNKLRVDESSLKSASVEKNEGANIIVSSMSESILRAQPMISSGFTPGVDDWEFTNYGSYIASGGHCAGQTVTSMWYYFEKKAGEGSLFSRFSESPKLWQDNARGYRLCSVIQEDMSWEGEVQSLFGKYIDRNQETDQLKICGSRLDLLPGFDPFPFISCYAKTAVIDWVKIGKRYSELLDNTIGTVAPNAFPSYTIRVLDGAGYEMKDDLAVTRDTLRTIAICPDSKMAYVVNGQRHIGIEVYDQNGDGVSRQEGSMDPKVPLRSMNYVVLKPGLNRLGYYVAGWLTECKYDNGNFYNVFVDFKWFDV